ncbi:MAG: DUF475 domain-containing protein [Epsilonproteobacteria bacterium]|nr:DUF475 domain-containing protein [Campylobacterota bacterium]
MKYFYSSTVFLLIGLYIAYILEGFAGVYIAALLALLEVSLSFDNAVVNAKILQTMQPIWQKRFMTWGMIIAVFGMRFLFPILIVMIVAHLGFLETLDIALHDPQKYHHILSANEKLIFAFGGAFLLMVFFDFFFEKKEIKWIKLIEDNKVTNSLGKISNIELILATIIGIVLTYHTRSYQIAIAFYLGLLVHSLLVSVDELFDSEAIKNGLMGFVYLEVLDASFSFDGVIGAFALSQNIFLIMIGLGIGAMFVRSLTIFLVEKGVLNEYKYLEHGAHYAIAILAVIMLLKIFFHISEEITGTIGILLISISFVHSFNNK